VVFAAFAAMFLPIHHDDLREFDTAYIQEVLKSTESLLAQSDRQAVYLRGSLPGKEYTRGPRRSHPLNIVRVLHLRSPLLRLVSPLA
jgi:hypothetical protein